MRKPPRRAGRPSYVTRAFYYSEGRRLLAKAAKDYAEAPLIEALILSAADEAALRPNTSRTYALGASLIIRGWARLHGLSPDWVNAQIAEITIALERRRTRKKTKGSSIKAKHVEEDVARAVFKALKTLAMKRKSIRAACAGLYIAVAPRIGCRPVELGGAWVEGPTLHLPNAKRVDGQSEYRTLDMSGLAPSLVEAIGVLATQVPTTSHRAFVRWRKNVAEALAVGCENAGCDRLSLYVFRHIALATWEACGYSAAEVAEIAGHLGIDTARKNYARAQHGWTRNPENQVKPVAQALGNEHHPGAGPSDNADKVTMPAREVDLEEMPVPSMKKKPTSTVDIREYDERVVAPQMKELKSTIERMKARAGRPSADSRGDQSKPK